MEELNNNDKKIIDLSYDIDNEFSLNERKKIDDLYKEYFESIKRVKFNNQKIHEQKNLILNNNEKIKILLDK